MTCLSMAASTTVLLAHGTVMLEGCGQPSSEAFCCPFALLRKLSVPSSQISAPVWLLGTIA
jgi:hypothetical protein